jgi:hypothetical protein
VDIKEENEGFANDPPLDPYEEVKKFIEDYDYNVECFDWECFEQDMFDIEEMDFSIY